jgi:hypothetical protein
MNLALREVPKLWRGRRPGKGRLLAAAAALYKKEQVQMSWMQVLHMILGVLRVMVTCTGRSRCCPRNCW